VFGAHAENQRKDIARQTIAQIETVQLICLNLVLQSSFNIEWEEHRHDDG
jgi:hypothetical protein